MLGFRRPRAADGDADKPAEAPGLAALRSASPRRVRATRPPWAVPRSAALPMPPNSKSHFYSVRFSAIPWSKSSLFFLFVVEVAGMDEMDAMDNFA
jgi:hypothetical protein